MSKQKRYSFVLTELLIAISLFAILLTVLFGIFSRYTKVDHSLSLARLHYEKLLIAQTKLQRILSNTVYNKIHNPYFFLESPDSLVFTFDNEREMNNQLPVHVLGKLYLENQNLYLALWDHNEDTTEPPEKFRNELILEHIEAIHFSFFKAPTSTKERPPKAKSQEDPEIPECQWINYWPKNFKGTPSLIKITLTPCGGTNREKEITLSFLLPNEIKPIIYGKK